MTNFLCPNCKTSNTNNNTSCTECNHDLKLENKYYLKKIINKKDIVTYLALDKNKKEVVIKEFCLKESNIWDDHKVFQKEADILSQLKHSTIPKFIESFELGLGTNSKSYIVMEYIDGISLKDEQKNKRYTEKEIIKDIIQIANILEYLHNLLPPVIHQDLNLSNIIRRKSGGLALIDFNSVQDVVLKDRNLDITGTYGYIAPEQLDGKPVTASDYYSLGIAILLLLTKKTPDEMLDDKGNLNWKKDIHASERITKLIEKLLVQDPKKRVSSLKEIKEILYEKKKTKKKEVKQKNNKPSVKVKNSAGTFTTFAIILSVIFPIALTFYINKKTSIKIKDTISKSRITRQDKKQKFDKEYKEGMLKLKNKKFFTAKTLFTISCQRNRNADACYQIGELYQNGRGRVKQDKVNTINYYNKGCSLGSKKACAIKEAISELLVAKEYQKKKDYKKANIEFLKSCKKGWTESCEFIAWNYENGSGYRKNLKKAKEYYKNACEKNSAYSCNKIGYFHEEGKATVKNLKKARAFYEKSCKLKFGLACSNFAKFYLKGLGGRKNKAYAKRYYKKACKLGYKKACK